MSHTSVMMGSATMALSFAMLVLAEVISVRAGRSNNED